MILYMLSTKLLLSILYPSSVFKGLSMYYFATIDACREDKICPCLQDWTYDFVYTGHCKLQKFT